MLLVLIGIQVLCLELNLFLFFQFKDLLKQISNNLIVIIPLNECELCKWLKALPLLKKITFITCRFNYADKSQTKNVLVFLYSAFNLYCGILPY